MQNKETQTLLGIENQDWYYKEENEVIQILKFCMTTCLEYGQHVQLKKTKKKEGDEMETSKTLQC